MKLFFPRQAKDENEATPLGNGHIGLWAYRGGEKETVHLNEATFWSGGPRKAVDSRLHERMLKARECLFAGKYYNAEKALLAGSQPIDSEEYDPIGDLVFETPGEKTSGGTLDLDSAVLTVKNKLFSRAYFVSYPDKVFVIRMESETPANITFEYLNKYGKDTKFTDNSIVACGNAIHEGMAFCTYISIDSDGERTGNGDALVIKNAQSITVIGIVVTGFVSPDKTPEKDAQKLIPLAQERVEAARKKGGAQLLTAHEEDYGRLFERNSLLLGEKAVSITPETELKKKTPSPALVTAYYEFSKYLTLSASREDSPAMNLQGIWNKNIHPAWRSNYTVNINTEMNYWFPDCADLAGCYRPLENLVGTLSVTGKEVAGLLGCEGYCSFHNADIWGFCSSVEGMLCYSFFPLAGVWLCCELMNHYRYTLDKEYLERIYPYLKGSCDFLLSFLVEKDGKMVTAPSTSPEHRYKALFRRRLSLTVSSACDIFLCRQLFDDVIECASILEKDDEYVAKVRETKEKLAQPTIDKKGWLNEFHQGTKEDERGHRHFSHLIGAFPLRQVGYYGNNQWMPAVKKSLDYRLKHGSGYTGWSCGWALNLLEQTHNEELFKIYLRKLFNNSTYPNMLDRHPPFQIDGNFGAGRAIAGMVAISEDNVIELLPVRVEQNKFGSVKNLCLPGGYKLTFSWENHSVKNLSVYSETAETVSFRNRDDGSVRSFCVRPKEYSDIDF